MSQQSKNLPDLPPRPRNWLPLWLGLCLIIFQWIGNDLEFSVASVVLNIHHIGEYLSRYTSPDFSELPRYLRLMGETLAIAFWGTFVTFILSIILAPLATKNLSPHPVLYRICRELLNIWRTIPDVVLALIFVSALDPGPLSGVLALGIHMAGVLGKFFADSMERVEPGIYETLWSTGASFPQVIAFAAIPSIFPEIIGYTLYTFDRNVRMATILGLVGAGGIGVELEKTMGFFQYEGSAAILIVILFSIVLIDYLSAFIRKRIY